MVKQGYSQTEIGIMPTQWTLVPLPNVVWFQEGPGVRTAQFTKRGVKLFNGSNIEHGKILLDKTDRHISEHEAYGQYSHFLADSGDIVIACSGISVDRFDEKVSELDSQHLPLCMNTSTMRFKVTSNKLNKDFYKSFLRSNLFKEQIGGQATGSAQLNFGPAHVSKVLVPLPPIAEQEAIAEALTDADALISSLENLIAKKRAIKTATMQQLLTDNKRLPGFSGEWETKSLGNLLTVRHGKSQHHIVRPGGAYPILATSGEIGRTDTPLFSKPSVLIGRKGTIDKPQYQDTPFWTIDTLFYTEIATHQALPKFIYYKFLMVDWPSYNEASGVPSLNASTIESIDILCPKIEEQTAITAVLSDMGVEIEALEARLEKTRAIKQGMMQELLTGRIRLV